MKIDLKIVLYILISFVGKVFTHGFARVIFLRRIWWIIGVEYIVYWFGFRIIKEVFFNGGFIFINGLFGAGG